MTNRIRDVTSPHVYTFVPPKPAPPQVIFEGLVSGKGANAEHALRMNAATILLVQDCNARLVMRRAKIGLSSL